MLAVESLTKSVSGGRGLFRDLSLHVDDGEFVAIKGESGVGKSTLLNLVAGLDQPDSGRIRFAGASLGDLDDDARTRLRRDTMGFVFQAFHVLPHLSIEKNVALPLVLIGRSSSRALSAAAEILEQVGLGGRGDDFPRQLSGGELQRVAIARALIHRPRLVLADEPTGNLDPDTAERILALFTEQIRQYGASVLLVTHSEMVGQVADRCLKLTREGLMRP